MSLPARTPPAPAQEELTARLAVENLTAWYGPVTGVRNVSLSFAANRAAPRPMSAAAIRVIPWHWQRSSTAILSGRKALDFLQP